MARLDNEAADAVEYNWFERDPATKTVYTNAGLTLVGSTTLTMDDAGNAVNHLLEKGMVLMNDRTREFIQISSAVTASGTTVDVTRGFGGTAGLLFHAESHANVCYVNILVLGRRFESRFCRSGGRPGEPSDRISLPYSSLGRQAGRLFRRMIYPVAPSP